MTKNNIRVASFLGALSLSLSFTEAAQAQCRASDIAQRQRGDIAIDAATGTILYASNENERFYQASLTKRMTLLLTLRAIRDGTLTREQIIQLPSHRFRNAYGAEQDGDPIPYSFARINVENAIIAMNVRSSNRAPYALAETISGSEANFVVRMNETAQALGMNNTRFANSNGFPVPNVVNRHYTTASDHAKLVQALYNEFPDEMSALNVASARLEAFNANGRSGFFTVQTTNRLMPEAPLGNQALPNVIGGKTGYACAAGMAMDVEAIIHDRLVIVVTGGHQSATSRNDLAYNLIRYPGQAFMERLEESGLIERAREIWDNLGRLLSRDRTPSFNEISLPGLFSPSASLSPDRIEALPPGPLPSPHHQENVMAAIIERPREEVPSWQPVVF